MTPMEYECTNIEAECEPADDMAWAPPPCQMACPVGTDIPSYVGLIWDGDLKGAMDAITATNPFSTICGRVCASPCEESCKRSDIDGPVAIRHLKRYVMDKIGGEYTLPPVQPTRKESVAVVGGGPTGLTAAQDLAVAGFHVHVYEKSEKLGGMMNAIPRFRLPSGLIEQDIDRILKHCPGIEIHLNTGLGDGVTLEELKEKHDAVLLSIGLWKDRALNVPGEDAGLEGYFGIEFLDRIANGEAVPLNGKVIVVGGGNVAMDTARTALRCGETEVHLYCLESREEMPAWEHEIAHAEAEGIVVHTSWGPSEILSEGGKVTGIRFKKCLSVFDDEGRFAPTFGKETLEAGADAVLLAIGLMADNPALENAGLLARGRVPAVFESMKTTDEKVFAAGDCAFGPSAIVYAMDHGHRAAFAIQSYLDGVKDPAYERPFRNRHIPVAQEPSWEVTARESAEFFGLGDDRCSFGECEGVFDPETASRQAGRCLRCDAETGTANYSRRARSLIQDMSAAELTETATQSRILRDLLAPRENPFPTGRPAHLDDVVFLSAALTRLVIDPYREKCNTKTRISAMRDVVSRDRSGRGVELEQPYLFTGFDEAPEDVRAALFKAVAATGCGYIGRVAPVSGDAKAAWFQLVDADTTPDKTADGLVFIIGDAFSPVTPERLHPDQLLGLSVRSGALDKALPFALENGFDFMILDGTSGIETPWPELSGFPDLTAMSGAIRILRGLNREEEIGLIVFGGMRSGTDVAKTLALNCNAAAFSVAAAIAMGGTVRDGGMSFPDGPTMEERAAALENWIKATVQETAIIARCTGKTNVHNLEPEDMRTISLATSEAMNLPLASGPTRREHF